MRSKFLLIIVLAVAGCAYGILSARMNQNPYSSALGSGSSAGGDLQLAWNWEPSPLWLPSYLLCKCPPNGIGISYTRSGYLFRSEAARTFYFVGSGVVGAVFGLLVGFAIVILRKREKVE